MRQVVPAFTQFVQMPFASNITPTQSKLTKICVSNIRISIMIGIMALDYAFALMGPGSIAGEGEIISIAARLDAP
jgi:hypothetical protein